MPEKNEKLDATISNAPPKPDNLNAGAQADMAALSKDGKLKSVLDGQGAPIPSNFANADDILAPEKDKTQKDQVLKAQDLQSEVATKIPKEPIETHAPERQPRTDKLDNGSRAEIDKAGHLSKLTYANGDGYKYEWLKDQLVSIDSFDKSGNVKSWLEKNNDGSWTNLRDGEVLNSDLSVNQSGDFKWTHHAGPSHKEGDVEIHRTNGSHTFISKADHTWVTKYPDGEERKIKYDEKTNNPCEYWAPKPHSSHWKSADGLHWNQIGADGKQLNKPPMIGKFDTDDENGGFTFINLGEKNNPHITAYDGAGNQVKIIQGQTVASLVSSMVDRYAERLHSVNKQIPKGQFEADSKNRLLSIDDRIAAMMLTQMEREYTKSNIKVSASDADDLILAFRDLARRTETGDTAVNEHIFASVKNEETKEDGETS